MKATELRIGNYFMFGAMRHRVSYHDMANICRAEERGETIAMYQPVPLSEEWLLKFGFESKYKDTLFIISIQELHLKKLVLHRSHLDMNLWAVAFADYYTGVEKSEIMPTTIYYVHQLQNLFHSLTGTELTLNHD